MFDLVESQFTFAEFSKVAQKLSCEALSELRKLILEVPNNEELFSYSARYEGVDKLVLWNSDDKKMQIRLHVYSGSPCTSNDHNQIDIGKAHNHRWNFSTQILSGGYHHTLYRMDLLEAEKYCLTPIMMRHENVGSSYALHHSQFHSVIEEPNTVSLIVRGPMEKECFQVVTEERGEMRLQDAPTLQTFEEKRQKIMTLAGYEKILQQLFSLKIIENWSDSFL